MIARSILKGLFYVGEQFINVPTFIQNIIVIEICRDFHSLGSAYSCDLLPKSNRHTLISSSSSSSSSSSIPVAPTWSIGHSWNASFHFSFLIDTQSLGLLGGGISQSQDRYLTQTQNKHQQIYMPRVGFEPMIPVFERAKIFHALDRAVTVISKLRLSVLQYIPNNDRNYK
jgi:hypothetical protein